ncbi:MAG: BON domain-containing protein [Acidobacteriota bacterium]
MNPVLKRSSGVRLSFLIAGMLLFAAGTRIALGAQVKVSDDALRDRIEHRLQTDAGLRRYDIRVKVDNGDVTLRGTVANGDQKKEAETLAKLAGVDDIDNKLDVDKDADQVLANRAGKGLRRSGEAVTDSWVTSKVRWLFMGDPALDGSKIDVDTKRGVVTLDGRVATEEGRARANELATYPDGVLKVVDKMKVNKD